MRDDNVYTMWTEIIDENGDITHAPLRETRCHAAGLEILKESAKKCTAPAYIEVFSISMPWIPGVIIHKNAACKAWEAKKNITALK